MLPAAMGAACAADGDPARRAPARPAAAGDLIRGDALYPPPGGDADRWGPAKGGPAGLLKTSGFLANAAVGDLEPRGATLPVVDGDPGCRKGRP